MLGIIHTAGLCRSMANILFLLTSISPNFDSVYGVAGRRKYTGPGGTTSLEKHRIACRYVIHTGTFQISTDCFRDHV